MSDESQRYDRWKAPPSDGGTLIWPEPDRLLASVADNHRRLSTADSVLLQNTPLPEVRKSLRQFLGNSDDDQPIVATGHQAELYHPGVWAKNALINAVAERVGGSAIHFAVDTDEPKHLILRWPGGAMPLSDSDASTAAWSGLLGSPSPVYLDTVAEAVAEASARWNFKPMLGEFIDRLRPLALDEPTLPAALVNASHALDWSLGLRQHVMMVSPMLLAEPYLLFVHHVLARAGEFASDYNAALADYRVAAGIHSPGRPMPDLRIASDNIEVPFWLDDLAAASRTRAHVTRRGAQLTIVAGEDAFVLDPAAPGWDAARSLSKWLMQHRLRFSPRALTLTAVLRLLVADQFVHGIGGGQYDQVLDGLIARHLRIAPPAFALTTATLFFPDAVGRTRVCLDCLIREGHSLRHRAIGFDKNTLVAAIAAAPRRSAARRELFSALHEKLATATTPIVRNWEADYAAAVQQARHERILFDRELFYAIQPRDRLTHLINRYRAAFGLAPTN
jgi:hypothetical protein